MIKISLIKVIILTFFLILFVISPAKTYAGLDITSKKVQPIIIIPRYQKLHPAYQKAVDEANLKVQTWYKDQLGGNTFQLLPSRLVYSEKSLKDYRCGVGQGCPDNDFHNLYMRVIDDILMQKLTIPGSILETWVIGAGGWAAGDYWQHTNWGFTVIGDWNLDLIADLYPNGPTGNAAAVLEPPTKSSQIGTIAHELGHAFTLQHTVPPDDDRSIMGQAFRTFPKAELVDTPKNRERSVFTVGNEPIKNTLLTTLLAQTKAQAEVVSIPRNLQFKATVTCGSNNSPVPNVDIDLKAQYTSYTSQILARATTDAKGETAINYTDRNNVSTFELLPSEFNGQKLPTQTIAFARDTPDSTDNAYHKSFHFNQCPTDQSSFSPRTLGVTVSLKCGEDKKPVLFTPIHLEMLSDDSNLGPKEVKSGLSLADGSLTMDYGTKPGDSMRFRIYPDLISELPPPEPREVTLQLTKNSDYFEPKFIYPVCPTTVPSVQKTVAQIEPNLEQIIISDQNSQSQVIEEPEKQQQIMVNPTADKPVTVDEVYSDGTVKQYAAPLEDGDTTKVGNVEIKAKVVKKITKLEVNGKSVDFTDPENVLAEATLSDQPSDDGAYRIPVVVCFNNSEDDCIRTAYIFHLNQPEQPAPASNSCPDDEFCEAGTITEKYGGTFDTERNECVYNFRRTERTCQ